MLKAKAKSKVYYSHFMALCPGLPGWAGTTRNIHPLTPILIINHPLSAFSIYCNPWHPPYSIYVPDSLFPQSPSRFSWVHVLVWNPPLYTSYIFSPNHCLLFAAHAYTIAICFAVGLKLYHLILVPLSQFFTWNFLSSLSSLSSTTLYMICHMILHVHTLEWNPFLLKGMNWGEDFFAQFRILIAVYMTFFPNDETQILFLGFNVVPPILYHGQEPINIDLLSTLPWLNINNLKHI